MNPQALTNTTRFQLPDTAVKDCLRFMEKCTMADFEHALNKKTPLEIEDFCALLSPHADKRLEELARHAHQVTRHRFGATINLYAPVYVSSYCNSGCRYCGFSASNNVARRRLSVEEVLREVETIGARGIQNVLLVAGCDPYLFDSGLIYEMIAACHRLMPSVSVEIEPTSEDLYRKMVGSGLDGLVVYQETYQRDIYATLHPSGNKRDFNNRLAIPEHGARAGIRRVGLGVLLGLADWRYDLVALGMHLQYLIRAHWRTLFTVSLPRYRAAGIDFIPAQNVDDRTFTRMICALRLLLHDTPVYLSTRESPRIRDGLVNCGVTHLSAGSKTSPGGYSQQAPQQDRQFETDDNRSPQEIALMLKTKGLEPVWKDWEGVLND